MTLVGHFRMSDTIPARMYKQASTTLHAHTRRQRLYTLRTSSSYAVEEEVTARPSSCCHVLYIQVQKDVEGV